MNIIGKFRRLITGIRCDLRQLSSNVNIINMSGGRDYNGQIIHSNWGDDINWYFLKEISSKKIILKSDLLLRRNSVPNLLAIGSVLGLSDNKYSIVWGSGLLDSSRASKVSARDIRAVRGPLTRKALITAGISCPDIYGDPALLLPLHYVPKKTKTHRLGIIPQYDTIDDFVRFTKSGEVKIISPRGYTDWHDFIDEITSCDCIVSMSLHGLIVAEAYNIPSKWVESIGRDMYSRFKYYDFYQSIGKYTEDVMVVDDSTTVSALIESTKPWKAGRIDLMPLINACPFKIIL